MAANRSVIVYANVLEFAQCSVAKWSNTILCYTGVARRGPKPPPLRSKICFRFLC